MVDGSTKKNQELQNEPQSTEFYYFILNLDQDVNKPSLFCLTKLIYISINDDLTLYPVTTDFTNSLLDETLSLKILF